MNKLKYKLLGLGIVSVAGAVGFNTSNTYLFVTVFFSLLTMLYTIKRKIKSFIINALILGVLLAGIYYIYINHLF